jgi:hypothetical protein
MSLGVQNIIDEYKKSYHNILGRSGQTLGLNAIQSQLAASHAGRRVATPYASDPFFRTKYGRKLFKFYFEGQKQRIDSNIRSIVTPIYKRSYRPGYPTFFIIGTLYQSITVTIEASDNSTIIATSDADFIGNLQQKYGNSFLSFDLGTLNAINNSLTYYTLLTFGLSPVKPFNLLPLEPYNL